MMLQKTLGKRNRRKGSVLVEYGLLVAGVVLASVVAVTLLGRNGAGKTTTLRSLIGLTPPRQGRVELFGADVTGLSPYRIAETGVGYVPEGRRIFANLTVEENLLVPFERLSPAPLTTSGESLRVAIVEDNAGGEAALADGARMSGVATVAVRSAACTR